MWRGIDDAVARYTLDGSDEDLKRLLRISELLAETARARFAESAPKKGGGRLSAAAAHWEAWPCSRRSLAALGGLSVWTSAMRRCSGRDRSLRRSARRTLRSSWVTSTSSTTSRRWAARSISAFTANFYAPERPGPLPHPDRGCSSSRRLAGRPGTFAGSTLAGTPSDQRDQRPLGAPCTNRSNERGPRTGRSKTSHDPPVPVGLEVVAMNGFFGVVPADWVRDRDGEPGGRP